MIWQVYKIWQVYIDFLFLFSSRPQYWRLLWAALFAGMALVTPVCGTRAVHFMRWQSLPQGQSRHSARVDDNAWNNCQSFLPIITSELTQKSVLQQIPCEDGDALS